jgi:hypothetical protein
MRANKILNARDETCRLVSCGREIGSRIGSAVTVRSSSGRGHRDKPFDMQIVPFLIDGSAAGRVAAACLGVSPVSGVLEI